MIENSTPTHTFRNAGLLCAAVVVVVVVVFLNPPKPPTPPTLPTCIEVPQKLTETTRKPAVEFALELETLKLDSGLKQSYEEKCVTAFQKLSEKDLALLILMRAIECYLEKADTKEKQELVKLILPDLVAAVRAAFASAHGLKGASGRLTLQEREIIDKSQYRDMILDQLSKRSIDIN